MKKSSENVKLFFVSLYSFVGPTFLSLINLITIKIGEKLEKIGDLTFCVCENLEKIIIPNSVEYIRIQYFENCKKLSQIHFHNHIYSYDDLLEYKKFK